MIKEIDKNIGISKERYRLFFLMEDSFAFFRPKENVVTRDSKYYKCIYFQEHNCVSAHDVLLDILFSVRSGNEFNLVPGDVISICVNGITYSYKFRGFITWNPDKLNVNFEICSPLIINRIIFISKLVLIALSLKVTFEFTS